MNTKTINLRLYEWLINDVTKSKSDKDFNDVTLKDIAVVMNVMCGEGVKWQLAHALSHSLNLPYDDVCIALGVIFDKYFEISDVFAQVLFHENPKPSPEFFKARMEEYNKTKDKIEKYNVNSKGEYEIQKIIYRHYRYADWSRIMFKFECKKRITRRYSRMHGFNDKKFQFAKPYTRGGRTECVLVLPGGVEFIGESVCCLEDNFSYKTGRELAYKRAVKNLADYIIQEKNSTKEI